MSTTPDANADRTDPPSNLLLLAPSIGCDEDAVCDELLHSSETNRVHELLVSCLRSPAERLAARSDRRSRQAARTTVIDVETESRSSATTAEDAGLPAIATVEHAGDAADLIDLGERIDRHLESEAGERTLLCVHSLTALLQATDSERVFKFLDVLTRSVERADAVAHYHVDPDVHDRATVATLEVLFDAVVDLRDDRATGD